LSVNFIVRKTRAKGESSISVAPVKKKTQAEILFGNSVKAERQDRYKQALKHWLDDTGIKWDICATLHTPKAKRDTKDSWSKEWLAKQLRRYFNALDRAILKAGHRNRGERIMRWVVLEHEAGVGWHAHIAIKTPDGKAAGELMQVADKLWRKQCKQHTNGKFDDRLTKIEEIHGRFIDYMNKFVTGEEDSKGVLDLDNTYLPIN
jgi:hypothetical protein